MSKSLLPELESYLVNQLSFFGYKKQKGDEQITNYINNALLSSINVIRLYNNLPQIFNILQTHHSSIFLYKLSNHIYKSDKNSDLPEKIYLLNRMINGIDLFYKIDMPENFLIGHGLSSVFSRAEYGEYLVVFQNVTIGVQNGKYPSIGERVIIYPGSIVVGDCVIGKNSVIGAGVKLINKSIPENVVVYEKNSSLIFKENLNEIHKYFAIP